LLQRDNNTAFFHRVADGEKKKRTVFSLNSEHEVIQGTFALLDHATSFYKQLFGPDYDATVRLSDDIWGEE
jgi:hypothetical protein